MTSQGLKLTNRLAYVAIVVGAFFAGKHYDDPQVYYNTGYFHASCDLINAIPDRPPLPACLEYFEQLEGIEK